MAFVDEAKPGHQKHTFTGIRRSFPNRAIHMLIDRCLPVRAELFRRYEFLSETNWDIAILTFTQQGLQRLRELIAKITLERNRSSDPGTLEDRNKALEDFVKRANNPEVSLEEFSNEERTLDDTFLTPADMQVRALAFNWIDDPNQPQPTPGRIKNVPARDLIAEFDRLIVSMTRSPSADYTDSVHERDAADWQRRIRFINQLAVRAASVETPYIPTGWQLSERDGYWNADGSHDPELDEGEGSAGRTESGGEAPARPQR